MKVRKEREKEKGREVDSNKGKKGGQGEGGKRREEGRNGGREHGHYQFLKRGCTIE